MDDKVTGALIGLAGTLFGILCRDLYLFNRKRKQDLEDRQYQERRANQDVMWHYAAPLFRAVESLVYRLKEIVEERPAVYLLVDYPQTAHSDYKKTSTLYRLAALLGWIRAYRKRL